MTRRDRPDALRRIGGCAPIRSSAVTCRVPMSWRRSSRPPRHERVTDALTVPADGLVPLRELSGASRALRAGCRVVECRAALRLRLRFDADRPSGSWQVAAGRESDHGHRKAQVGDLARQVEMDPLRQATGMCCKDDLVEVAEVAAAAAGSSRRDGRIARASDSR